MRELRSRYSRLYWNCFAIMAIVSFQSCCVAQSEGLDDVANDLADQVAAALKDVPGGAQNGVDIESIDGRKTGGIPFRRAFVNALKKKGIILSTETKYNIDGTVRGEASDQSAAALVKLLLRGPNVERELTGKVTKVSDVITLLGVTGALPVKLDRPLIGLSAPVPGAGQAVAANEVERNAKLTQLIRHPEPPKVTPNPTPFIDPAGKPELSEVHVGAYAVEILIKDIQGRIQTSDGKRRYNPRPPVKDENGELFVDIHPGEIYAVRLINDSKDFDAGVKLTIDGLDCFQFSEVESYKELGMWVIPHESSGIISGWHTRNKNGKMELAEFEVGKYGEGLAEEMGANGDVGTITASFRAAWDPDQASPGGMLAYSSVRGTKKGEEVVENLSELKRHFGEIRAAISIRYQIAEAK